MADGITLNAGTGGSVVATDDIAGVHYQRVKIALGADGAAADAAVGGGTEAGSLRVTIASDSTGVLSVDDNGSTLSVDDGGSSLTVDNSGTFAVQITSIASGANNIGDVDVASLIPGTGATNLGKAEDAAHTSGDVGVMALSVRANTAAATSSADGDYQPLITDTNGRLHVIEPSAAGALTSLQTIDNIVAVDDAAFTVASGSGVPIMAVATSDTVDSGDVGALRMTTARGLHTVVVNSSGTVIDPQIDDAAFTVATSALSVVGGVYTTDSVDSGDAGAFAMTASRAQHVVLKTDTVGGMSVYRSLDLDETEEDVKTSAGTLYWIHAVNVTASPIYLKFYNAAAASVTVGTTAPVLTFPVPSQGTTGGAGFVLNVPQGIAFSTAICMAATTGVADSDTAGPATNALIVNVGYA